MSPWVVGKPVPYIAEKAPVCVHLKVVTEHLRECNHPKFLEVPGRMFTPLRCLYIDERLRDCAWYDSGIPGDKRALKYREKAKTPKKVKTE